MCALTVDQVGLEEVLGQVVRVAEELLAGVTLHRAAAAVREGPAQ